MDTMNEKDKHLGVWGRETKKGGEKIYMTDQRRDERMKEENKQTKQNPWQAGNFCKRD